MIKKSSSSENEPCCSKACKKNTNNLNSKIIELSNKLDDKVNMIYHYSLGLLQVKGRLVEQKERELKYCEKIRILEFHNESRENYIKILKKELELIKKEKEGVDGKLEGFLIASKDLDNLIESQRSDTNKEGLGYSVVPPPIAQIYSSLKKDLSWTGLPEFADDTITDYSRPSPAIKSTSDDAQNKNPSVTKTGASDSTILSKPFIKFMKAADCTEVKTNKVEAIKKSSIKYAEIKRVKKGTSRSQNKTHESFKPRPVVHRPFRPPGNSGEKLKDAVRKKRSRGVVYYILQVKKKLLTKKLKDSDTEYQV
nr:hypothetical protein [Tanacetum cinerariifolium]